MSSVCASSPISKANPVVQGSAARRPWLDISRFAAALAIVWLHTVRSAWLEPTAVLTRFAVPFFTAAAVYLVFESIQRSPWRSLASYARSRTMRIYVPFLAWSVIYLAFKSAKKVALPDQPNAWPGIEFLWRGGFWHLWFMPFILIASVGAYSVAKVMYGRGQARLLAGAFVIIGAALAIMPTPAAMAASPEYRVLIWNALPAIAWGISLGLWRTSHSREGALNSASRSESNMPSYASVTTLRQPLPEREGGKQWRASAGMVAVVGLVLCIAAEGWLFQSGRNVLAENLAGIGLLLATLAPLSGAWLTPLARLGKYSYGLYLAHLLIIKSCESWTARRSVPDSWPRDVAVFMLAAVLGTLLTAALQRFRYTAWLVA